jgi:hypothetical protein
MFAGSCIGVIALAMFFQFLQRISRVYDINHIRFRQMELHEFRNEKAAGASGEVGASKFILTVRMFNLTLAADLHRGFLHTLQLVVAYFLLALAM